MPRYSDIQHREVFHFLFLEALLRISDPTLYVIKGGANLRFFFKSPRYSEDMDLDLLAGNVGTLKKNGYKILESAPFRRALRTFGIMDLQINDPAKAKQTETTQRFRVRLMNEAGESLPTKVEFSRRQTEKLSFVLEKIDPDIAKPYQRLAFRCQHYSGETAVIQKVRALAGRDVTQARDVFDLGILHSGGYFKKTELQKSVGERILKEARQGLAGLDYEHFEGQVLEFLDENGREVYGSEEAWESLKETIGEMLDHEK
jgi:predicted nucleotidyltransferase component of viral defense system